MILRNLEATPFRIEVLAKRRGILTPDLCQICEKGPPGIVTVRGLNGRLFSAHRWPCAEREKLSVA